MLLATWKWRQDFAVGMGLSSRCRNFTRTLSCRIVAERNLNRPRHRRMLDPVIHSRKQRRLGHHPRPSALMHLRGVHQKWMAEVHRSRLSGGELLWPTGLSRRCEV